MLKVGGEVLILTHDALAAGVHFLPDADPADVAHKLVATNMSDLAAKGAVPVGVLLSYALGDDDARFLAGLAEALREYNVALLGGDTISHLAQQVVSLTAIGRASCAPVPSRGGAAVGDALWITGPVGAAMLGLEAIRAGNSEATASLAYRRPRALLAQGQALAPHVSAMMDVSDGLLLDAARMARASGVTLAIEAAAVPIATPEHRRGEALRWGDDYQLLFTMADDTPPPVAATRIGTALSGGISPLLLDGVGLDESGGLGYQHG